MNDQMTQTAPYPHHLAKLVKCLRYRERQGWLVELFDDYVRDPADTHVGEAHGMTLVVTRSGPNTYDPDEPMRVRHLFPVPAASYNEQSWMRWLFDRLGDVDTHERMENFAFLAETVTPAGGEDRDGYVRPFKPNHGPGWDPYLITVMASETDRRTSFRGELNDH